MRHTATVSDRASSYLKLAQVLQSEWSHPPSPPFMNFIEPYALPLGLSLLTFGVMTLRRLHLEDLEAAKNALHLNPGQKAHRSAASSRLQPKQLEKP